MLANAEKDDRDGGGVHHADESADHVAHGIALADDEAIEAPAPALDVDKLGGKVPGLGDRVGADEGLADHEDLVRVGQLAKLGQAGHEARVVVAAAGRVNQDNVEAHVVGGGGAGIGDGVAGQRGGVLAVALFEELDVADVFALAQLGQVAHVDAQLLDGTGAEGVGGADEDAEVVLKEEKSNFGERGGFADAVDTDDADDIGARGVGGGDGAQEIERGGRGEDACQGLGHGSTDDGVDAGEAACLEANKVTLDTLAQPDGSLPGNVLVQQVVFHAPERLGQVFLGQRLALDDVLEVATDGTQAGANQTGRGVGRGARLLGLGRCKDSIDLVIEILEDKLALCGSAAHVLGAYVFYGGRVRCSVVEAVRRIVEG